jgi:hypothetical protein
MPPSHDRGVIDGGSPALVPIDSGVVFVPIEAGAALVPIEAGAVLVPTDVPEPTSTVESRRALRWVLQGGRFRTNRVEIRPTLRGPTGQFRLGGMSMEFFGVDSCRACAAIARPFGMPPHAPLEFNNRRVLAQVGGGPVWAVAFGNCPSGARCTRSQAVPPGRYIAELGGTFRCPAVTIQLPLARDLTVPCRAPVVRPTWQERSDEIF